MCLITFAYKCHPDYSLILLANRDEFYQRPTEPMTYWQDAPNVLAGRDLEKLGTWLGLNKKGLFTAVTNFRDGTRKEQDKLSRGDLTRQYLIHSDTAQTYLTLLEHQKQRYGDFNLLLGDATGLYYTSNRGGQTQALSPGIYGMSNALLDTPWPKLDKVKARLQKQLLTNDLSESNLLNIMLDSALANDDQLPETGISLEWERLLSSCFIRSENYGTRAISLVLQETNGATRVIEHNYDAAGETGRYEYTLEMQPIGINPG